jgi:hypothetical protein
MTTIQNDTKPWRYVPTLDFLPLRDGSGNGWPQVAAATPIKRRDKRHGCIIGAVFGYRHPVTLLTEGIDSLLTTLHFKAKLRYRPNLQ